MAILNLLLALVIIAIHVIWVVALVTSDGKCHYDDCAGCPYEGTCPQEWRDK